MIEVSEQRPVKEFGYGWHPDDQTGSTNKKKQYILGVAWGHGVALSHGQTPHFTGQHRISH